LKTKILLVSSEFPPGPGGIGHHAYFLSKELSKNKDITIEIIAPADYTSNSKRIDFDNSHCFKIKRFTLCGWATYFIRIFQISLLLNRNNYTHLWASGKFSLWMIWIQRLIKPDLKTLCILHGSEVNLSNNILRTLTHNSILKYDTIVSVSNFTKSLLPKNIIDVHQSIKIIPNGVDLSTYQINGNLILEGFPALLTVGHVTKRKGQHRMIKALPELITLYPNIKYHIVGRPVETERLIKLAENLGVTNHVVFHGVVIDHKHLWDYYKASDIFMLLSENQINGDVEGFGIVALEANATGTPVVGSKYCGVEDAIDNRRSGVLVDGDNIKEIVGAINFCLTHNDKLQSFSISWAKQHDWVNIGEKFIDLI
jgi:phosphatidylinositol alpha-1,6-mannosyltransferase